MLTIRLKPSKRLAFALSAAHFTAIALLWPLALPTWVKLMGSALLALSLTFYVRHHAWLTSPRSAIGLELSDDMTCTFETKRGDRIACALLGSSFVAPYLTVLELKTLGPLRLWQKSFARHSIVILPDSVNTEDFRQLRVLLRWKWKDLKGLD